MYIWVPQSSSLFCLILPVMRKGFKHHLCADYCWGNGLKTEFIICALSHRIIYATDDLFNIEDLFCNLTGHEDRKSTRLNSSHLVISYAVFCLKKKKNNTH